MARKARELRKRASSRDLGKTMVDLLLPLLSKDQLSDLVYRMDADTEFLDRFIEAVDVHGRIRCPEMYADLTKPDHEDAADEEDDG